MRKIDNHSLRYAVELTKEGFYEEAFDILLKYRTYMSNPVILSCYALCRAAIERKFIGAERLCQASLRRDRTNPVIHLCLGRIYALSNKKKLAIATFKEGLVYSCRNKALLAALEPFGKRRPLLFPTLDRSHILNKACGISSTWLRKDLSEFYGSDKDS